jgi:hypothetical protein
MRELLKLLLDFTIAPVADSKKRGLVSIVAPAGSGKSYFCAEVATKFSASLIADAGMHDIAIEEVRCILDSLQYRMLDKPKKKVARSRMSELLEGGTYVVLVSLNDPTPFTENEARRYGHNVELALYFRLLYSLLCDTTRAFDSFLAAVDDELLQRLAAVPAEEIVGALKYVYKKKACFVILDDTERLADYQNSAVPGCAGCYLYPLRDGSIPVNEGKNEWRALCGGLEALSCAINSTPQLFVLVTCLSTRVMAAQLAGIGQVVLPLTLRSLMGHQFVVERAVHRARAAESQHSMLPIKHRSQRVTTLLTLVGMHPRILGMVAPWLSTEKDCERFTVDGVLALLEQHDAGVGPQNSVVMRAVLGENFHDEELQGVMASMGVLNVIHNNRNRGHKGVLLLAPAIVIAASRALEPLFTGLLMSDKHFDRYFMEWCKAQCIAARSLGKDVHLGDYVERVGDRGLDREIADHMVKTREMATHYLYRTSAHICEPSMCTVLAVVREIGSMPDTVRESSEAPDFGASTGGACIMSMSGTVHPGFDILFSSGDEDCTTSTKTLVAVQLMCSLPAPDAGTGVSTILVLKSVVETADALSTYLDKGWKCALLFCALKTSVCTDTLLFADEESLRLQLGAVVDTVCVTRTAREPHKYTTQYRTNLAERAMVLLKRTMVITRRGLRSFFGLTCAAALESQLGYWWGDADSDVAIEETAELYTKKELRRMCKDLGVESSGTKRELLER